MVKIKSFSEKSCEWENVTSKAFSNHLSICVIHFEDIASLQSFELPCLIKAIMHCLITTYIHIWSILSLYLLPDWISCAARNAKEANIRGTGTWRVSAWYMYRSKNVLGSNPKACIFFCKFVCFKHFTRRKQFSCTIKWTQPWHSPEVDVHVYDAVGIKIR